MNPLEPKPGCYELLVASNEKIVRKDVFLKIVVVLFQGLSGNESVSVVENVADDRGKNRRERDCFQPRAGADGRNNVGQAFLPVHCACMENRQARMPVLLANLLQ